MSKAEKKFGKKGFDAGFDEFNQLHKRIVFQPKKVSDLSKEEKPSEVLGTNNKGTTAQQYKRREPSSYAKER